MHYRESMQTLAEYIKFYRDYGLSILPLRGKTPLEVWKPYQKQQPSAETIYEWLLKYPKMNIGIITGLTSELGLAVLDIDNNDRFEKWQRENKILPKTTVVQTGRGSHWWYSIDKNLPSMNHAAFEIKADGCYIVVPPSKHPSGKHYKFINSLDHIEPLPGWLLDYTQTYYKPLPVFNSQTLSHHTGGMDCIDQVLDSDISEGQRDNSFFVLVNTLKKFNTHFYAEHIVTLKNASLKRPLPEYHLRSIFKTFYAGMGCTFIKATLQSIQCEQCTFNKRRSKMLDNKQQQILLTLTPAQQLIFNKISQQHILGATDLAKHTGFTRQTITSAKRILIAKGLIVHEQF